jgi:crossover junction endodeoxyribonuclease RusA
MIEIKLPWPPSALSPNARSHWAQMAVNRKKYRHDCQIVTRAQLGVTCNAALPVSGDLALTIEFHPPNLRKYDRDNLLARMKSGLDGMCDALSIDDARFEPITVSMQKKPFRAGYVQVKIQPGERP